MDIFSLFFLSTVLAVCCITDYRCRRILNIVTYPTMLLAIGYHFFQTGTSGFIFSFTGMVTGIALLIIPFLTGGMGAGDAKLLGAIGAFTGPKGVLIVFIYTALLGGIFAILLLTVKKNYREAFIAKHLPILKHFVLTRKWIPDETPFVKNSPKLCYGIAIAAGAFLYITEITAGLNLLTRHLFA